MNERTLGMYSFFYFKRCFGSFYKAAVLSMPRTIIQVMKSVCESKRAAYHISKKNNLKKICIFPCQTSIINKVQLACDGKLYRLLKCPGHALYK